MAGSRTVWDAELYEARHHFVWQFGEDLLKILDPKPGERILDLGCGPGQLTQKIAEHGADVLGLDVSPEMIGQARQNYPPLSFVLQDAAAMTFESEFNAVFSNAALHWMLDASRVVEGVARALKNNGRFVAELGGKGNIARIEGAIEAVLVRYHGNQMPLPRTFYPSPGQYSTLLETHGLEVRMLQLFDRPTPLEGEHGMESWIRQFKWYYFEGLPKDAQKKALREVVERLRPDLHGANGWWADYRRLRLSAMKL